MYDVTNSLDDYDSGHDYSLNFLGASIDYTSALALLISLSVCFGKKRSIRSSQTIQIVEVDFLMYE